MNPLGRSKLKVTVGPWSSGFGRRLKDRRSWVRILAPYTGWTFSHIFKIVMMFVWKRLKINWGWGWGWPIFLKKCCCCRWKYQASSLRVPAPCVHKAPAASSKCLNLLKSFWKFSSDASCIFPKKFSPHRKSKLWQTIWWWQIRWNKLQGGIIVGWIVGKDACAFCKDF